MNPMCQVAAGPVPAAIRIATKGTRSVTYLLHEDSLSKIP